MKKKLNIPKDFWKDFKNRKDFDEFFGELFQEGLKQLYFLLMKQRMLVWMMQHKLRIKYLKI